MNSTPPTIDYEALARSAMRGVVRSVLEQTSRTGLPGDHHFYISFDTGADGVTLSSRLKEKYPSEMTIVLQHRFRDLVVTKDQFEVKLTFDGIPERLVIPFDAIKVFFDPSVRYGLQFETIEPSHGSQSGPLTTGQPESGSDPDSILPAQLVPLQSISEIPVDDAGPTAVTGESEHQNIDGQAQDETPEVLDAGQVAAATDGAKIVRLDAFRKKST